MEQVPHSPEEVIDPRWSRYLHAQQPAHPATSGHQRPHQPGESSERYPTPAGHSVPDAELNARIAEVLSPWRTGSAGPRETLEALRDLADRLL